MGMEAYITAVGQFHSSIACYLDLEGEEMMEGVWVITDTEHCVTTDASRELAGALGIRDPWDFNEHCFDVDVMDRDGVAAILGVEVVEKLRILASAGFQLFYRPNG